MPTHNPDLMRSILQRIATGPELSKDISREEAEAGMRLILDGKVDPVQAGIFLIALRMKRETDEENLGILDAILDATGRVTAPAEEVVDIVDPYNGYNRTLPAAPFLPAVLSACGVATLSQGVERMGPKFGVTHKQILRAAGADVDLSTQQAADRLGKPACGWSYVDQKAFCPKLYALEPLRTLIVKRPAITTIEVLTGPICGQKKTHLVTGYVHKPYPRVYSMLARHTGFDSALFIRGVEGGVIPSLRQTGKVVHYHDKGEEQSTPLEPSELGIEQTVRAVSLPEEFVEKTDSAIIVDTENAAKAAAKVGLAALEAQPGPIRDGLVYAGAICLWHLGRQNNLSDAATAVRKVLDNGEALSRFKE
ncbi:MAG TPA: anthranilate phosphoribosyltransferase [Acidiferrobacteraceae bacterium]|nr:anthranilate phosphoribosyltransferase [Acidiferrobacteraceae bacterium]